MNNLKHYTRLLLTLGLIIITSAESIQAQPGGRGGFGGGRGGRGGFGGGSGERVEPEDLTFEQGVAAIPDRETFEKLSYQGPEVMRDGYLAGLEFVKFIVEGAQTDKVRVYFMNTENYRAHPPYMQQLGIQMGGSPRGAITWLPRLKAPNGESGLYIVDFEPNDSYSYQEIKYVLDTLTSKMPILKGRVAFHPLQGNVARYEREKELYEKGGLAVHRDEDLYKNIAYLPLNSAESFGMLRIMEHDGRPSPRDVVIYKTLPNQMPRVAGVITEVRQTPLSHVNLRAVQDKIPNAFIENAMESAAIKPLIGKFVSYKVEPQGYKIREATKEEVDNHFAALRPTEPQIPERDLSAKTITALADIGFEDSVRYGVKAANIAAMQTFKFPEGTIPDGFAVPFYFYDEFMKHNGFYDAVDAMVATPEFQNDRDVQEKQLKELRAKIESAEMPEWMMTAFADAHAKFPAGSSVRCRSSTNNEDLPGFSGAGLYDSCTHKPDEGHFSKSIKQVYASLWNFRAFEEREFYRIDHKLAAMGVLLHPNQKGEKANGVAVTDDILYETNANYYVNTQIGEDLVTNPDEESSPEEILLAWYKEDGDDIVRRSAQAPDNGQLISNTHMDQLRKHLGQIHGRFARLYNKKNSDKFAMEIEFKITKDGQLLIKQARPWVY